MSDFNEKLRKFAVDLFKIDAIKFGEYKMKVGLLSPIYCDLRVIISYPEILNTLAELLIEQINATETHDLICGVPYTALPIATVISIKTGIPMVLRRKEAKDYGTRKIIEGKYEKGNRCMIIEDVITSGGSILETVKDLESVELSVTDAFVVLNREQGGEITLQRRGYEMHSLLTITQLLTFLLEAECIDHETVDKVLDYLEATQISAIEKPNRLYIFFNERVEYCENIVGKNLFKLMHEKETNLCVAADLTRTEKILQLAESVAPYICILKIHVDIIENFDQTFIERLQKIAKEGKFMIMEDRKFADIGNTVSLQYNKGMYSISSWADLVTAHSLSGDGLLKALSESGQKDTGIFLIGEMSSAGNLASSGYLSSTIKMALNFPTAVTGIVCQSKKFIFNPGLIQLSPGIKLNESNDDMGQQYNSPQDAVLERGADIGVVGRGIIHAEKPDSAAAEYRKHLWDSYLRRIYVPI